MYVRNVIALGVKLSKNQEKWYGFDHYCVVGNTRLGSGKFVK